MFTLDSLVSQPSVLKPISPVSISDTAQHAESTTPVSARAQNLMMQYHDMNSNHSIPVGDDEHHFFDCPKVWEKIVSHPRFDEIDDVEALCQELNAKVRIVRAPLLLNLRTDLSALIGMGRVWIGKNWKRHWK